MSNIIYCAQNCKNAGEEVKGHKGYHTCGLPDINLNSLEKRSGCKYCPKLERAMVRKKKVEEITMTKEEYTKAVIEELKKQEATKAEMALLHEETILNGMRNNRKPEDVAYAILQ